MAKANTSYKQHLGFTLVEVMLVILVIGLMVAAMQINFVSNKPEAKLAEESARFAGVFEMAADYSLLNNIEMGLYVEKGSYRFVGFDGTRWSEIPENELLSSYDLPEALKLSLVFEDLPIDPEALISRELFEPDEDDFDEERYDPDEELGSKGEKSADGKNEDGTEVEQKPIIPHVYILSGGEITPFKLIFSFRDEFSLEENMHFEVTGLYDTPLDVVGPVMEDQ